MQKHAKVWAWGSVIGLFLITLYSMSLAMLCFCVVFQVSAGLGIIHEIKKAAAAKYWESVEGRLIDFRTIKGDEEEEHNYEGEISFLNSSHGRTTIKHKFSSISKPEVGKLFEIKVNAENIDESVAANEYNLYWKFKMCLFVVIILGLCYVDVRLFQEWRNG